MLFRNIISHVRIKLILVEAVLLRIRPETIQIHLLLLSFTSVSLGKKRVLLVWLQLI